MKADAISVQFKNKQHVYMHEDICLPYGRQTTVRLEQKNNNNKKIKNINPSSLNY